MTEEENPDAPNWLRELEAKRERRLKAKLGHEAGAGSPCLNCKNDCPGLDLHFWRKICKNCKCGKESHDVQDDDIFGWTQFQLLGSKPAKSKKIVLPGKKEEVELDWTPHGPKEVVEKYLKTLPPELLPVKGSAAAQERKQLLQKQIPIHDIDPSLCDSLTEDEVKKMNDYVSFIKENSVGVGQIVQLNLSRGHVHNKNVQRAQLLSDRLMKDMSVSEDVNLKRPEAAKNLQSTKSPNISRLSLNIRQGTHHPENVKNLPVFRPNVINKKDDEVFPVFPSILDKTFPLGSGSFNEKFSAPSPYAKLPFTPNVLVENSFPVGGPRPKYATVLNPNNRTVEDLNRLPVGFREKISIIAPNGERIHVCSDNKYYEGPKGEKLVESPNGERFFVDPRDGKYAVGPGGERFLIGPQGEKYFADPQDERFVIARNGDKCFVPKDKFAVGPDGKRYQVGPGQEIYLAEPDNDKYLTGPDGRRYQVAPTGHRYPVDPEDGRLVLDTNGDRILVGPKGEKYMVDPHDKGVLIGPNEERYLFPKDRYKTSPNGERYLDGPGGQKYFADPNDDRYCAGPRGERHRVDPKGNIHRVDPEDARFCLDTTGKFLLSPDGAKYYQDRTNPNYVVGPKGERYPVAPDDFLSGPNGERYLPGTDDVKYYADPNQNGRAIGPNGEKYLLGPDNQLFAIDPKDKRFARDGQGKKFALGPNGEVYFTDPDDDRYVVGPDKQKYFSPRDFFNTGLDGKRFMNGPDGKRYRADPRDDRYALGPNNERHLVGPDGVLYPTHKDDGRFALTPSGEKFICDPEGRRYLQDPQDPNCVIGPNGERYYVPPDKYKTNPEGDRFVLNNKGEKCVPNPADENYAIAPKGNRYFVGPQGETYAVDPRDGRFFQNHDGRPFLMGPNGEKYFQDPLDKRCVIGPNNQKITLPEDKYVTGPNGERYLRDPHGRKFLPHPKDDRFLVGPNGEKYQIGPDRTLYKVSPDDGRFLLDDENKKFILGPNGRKYYEYPQENKISDPQGRILDLPKDRYLTGANGERYLPGPGGRYYPDPVDENYAIGPTGERYLVDPQGILYPVDPEDGRYAKDLNGERFVMGPDGKKYYPDPYDPKCVTGAKGEKYFIPKDKFVTSPTGERYLRGPNGEKYVPDPRNDDRAIGPDGKLYDVSPTGEIVPLGSLQNFPGDTQTPQIVAANGETYLEDPDDDRLVLASNGDRCILGPNGEKYILDPKDDRYVIGPDGKRYFVPDDKYLTSPNGERYLEGPNGQRYYADPKDDRYCTDPRGKKYFVGPNKELYPVDPKDQRFILTPNGDRFILGPNGEKYHSDPQDYRCVIGPDGEKYVLEQELVGIPQAQMAMPFPTVYPDLTDPRFQIDDQGNRFVETVEGDRYYVNPEDDNFVKGPDGRNYMLPRKAKYIVSPGARRRQLLMPENTMNPRNESKYPSGGRNSGDFDPIAIMKNRRSLNLKTLPSGSTADQIMKPFGVETLPGGTTAEKGVRNKLRAVTPVTLNIPEDVLNPTKVNIGAINDITYEIPDVRMAEQLTNEYFYEPEEHGDVGEIAQLKAPTCHRCGNILEENSIVVHIERANAIFHGECFRCHGCNQNLADLLYFYDKDSDQIYCGRDYAKIRGIPRCAACDELIFTKEYCLAENNNFHIKHFCCFECDTPLVSKNYLMEDSQPMCLPCYDYLKANTCVTCERKIGPSETGAQLQNIHFHHTDECFVCKTCRKPLFGGKLLIKEGQMYCSVPCYSEAQA